MSSLKDDQGNLTETEQEATDTLNRFFKSLFLEEGQGEVPEFPEQVELDHSISSIEITPDEDTFFP